MDRRRFNTNIINGLYKRVEYLESTDTQHINTNFKILNNSKYSVKFKQCSTGRYRFAFGGADGNESAGVYYGDNGRTPYYTLPYVGSYIGTYTDNIQEAIFDIRTGTITLNGVVVLNEPITTTLTGQYPLQLFKMNKANYGNKGFTKIYDCKCWSNNVLVHNFIPCLRLSDNKPGMFDTVNNVFYTNSGTGEFLYGDPVYD